MQRKSTIWHHRNPFCLAAGLLAIFLNASLLPATAAPLSGTRTIGPTGDYASITAAIADVKAQTLGGPLVWELQSNYVSTVETFPLVFGNLTTTAANTLTLRPQLGATNLVITSAVTYAPTVDLNGAQYLTIDGRPGGAGTNAGSGGGTASQLTIADTSTSGWALRFINEASYNNLCYTRLRGVNNSPSSGVVFFNYSTVPNGSGNDNNTLDHCDIGDGASTPVNCIYSAGSGAPKDNSGNIIANCNIFNFYAQSGDQYGILLQGGNTDWTITGNSFYQSATRNGPGRAVGAVFINNPAGNNFVVSGNAIGGYAPNAAGNWYYGTYNANNFTGINLNVGAVTPSSVQGNLIQNFFWQTTQNVSTAPGVWSGITVSGGSVTIGTVAGNTIGGSALVSVTTSGSGALTTGISSTSTNKVVIANNTISTMAVYGLNNLYNASLTGILVTAGTNIISNNRVGSTGSGGNNFFAGTASPLITGAQVVTGISSSSSNSATITGNTVASLFNSYTNIFGGQVRGIITYDGANNITGNTVRNLTTACGDANSDASAAVLGICETSSQPGQTVSQNTVNSLASLSKKEAVFVTGIFYAGPAGGINVITRNEVDSLKISSTNMSSILAGMLFRGGSFTAQNNMVLVGSGTAGASEVFGIFDFGQDAGRNFYHNSAYVSGSQAILLPRYSAAFASSGSGNARTFRDNVFVNARSKTGSTGKPYAVVYLGSDLTGLTADANIYLASGTSGVLGRNTNVDCTTLTAWLAGTGQDASSLVADPLFLNASDLHVASNSPAINAGLPTGVTDDIDGDQRSPTTPTIGADEYIADYTLIPGYNQLSGQSFGGGKGLLAFQGLPGFNYALEMATNLVPPVLWQPLSTNGATANGSLWFTNFTSQSSVFYRTRNVP